VNQAGQRCGSSRRARPLPLILFLILKSESEGWSLEDPRLLLEKSNQQLVKSKGSGQGRPLHPGKTSQGYTE
jgi:hypothetical protein